MFCLHGGLLVYVVGTYHEASVNAARPAISSLSPNPAAVALNASPFHEHAFIALENVALSYPRCKTVDDRPTDHTQF